MSAFISFAVAIVACALLSIAGFFLDHVFGGVSGSLATVRFGRGFVALLVLSLCFGVLLSAIDRWRRAPLPDSPKYSMLAVASVLLSAQALLLVIPVGSLFSGGLALLLGVMAAFDQRRYKAAVRGKQLALAGVLIGTVAVAISITIILRGGWRS